MKLINWNTYYHLRTIKLRRDYIQSSFNDKEKSINKKLFLVNPIEPNENLSRFQKAKRQTSNFLKNTLRHLILPFPITWSHRNTDRLVKKKVYSIEDYMMGDYRHKDHISALRTGAPQYRSLLIGAGVTLIGLMLGISFGSMGAVPAIALGVSIGSLVAYSFYGALRASRKSKVQVGFLKSRMGNVPENNEVEKLFTRAYTLIRNLEDEKRNLDIGEDTSHVARDKIITTLRRNLSSTINDDKGESEKLSKLVKDHVETFIQSTASSTISKTELKNSLNTLISAIEDTDFYSRFEAANEYNSELIDKLIRDLQKEDALDPKVPVLEQLKELEQQYKQNGGKPWNKDQYIKEIQNSTTITEEIRDALIEKLGGPPVISFASPLFPSDILTYEAQIPGEIPEVGVLNSTASEEKSNVMPLEYLPSKYSQAMALQCPSDEEMEKTRRGLSDESRPLANEESNNLLSLLMEPINSNVSLGSSEAELLSSRRRKKKRNGSRKKPNKGLTTV